MKHRGEVVNDLEFVRSFALFFCFWEGNKNFPPASDASEELSNYRFILFLWMGAEQKAIVHLSNSFFT